MTDLIRAICEAENSGEIDLDTRDVMIDIITESKSIEDLRDELSILMNKKRALVTQLDSTKGVEGVMTQDAKHKNLTFKKGETIRTVENMKKKQFRGVAKDIKKLDSQIDDLKKKIAKMEQKALSTTALAKSNSGKVAKMESVRCSIFEKELAGEITPDERRVLLEYLESKMEDYLDDGLY